MKLTPLNIITSGCLVMGIYLLIMPESPIPVEKGMKGLVTGLYFLGAIIAFISDLIFRKFIPLTRNLWVVQCAFLVFSLVLIVILKMTIG